MNFPLTLRFKIVALAPQIFVEDAAGNTVCYVKQKMFKLKEQIEVFEDSSKSTLLANINADRIIDWSARYHFTTPAGDPLGSVGRRGMRSLWRAHYEIVLTGSEAPAMTLREENPWTKVMDGFFGELPIINLFSGYLFHPKYLVTRTDGTPVMRLTKEPAFWEGRFKVELLGTATPEEQLTLTLSGLMMLLLERRRG